LSQVLPITNETLKTSESNTVQRSDDSFSKKLEEEKLKVVSPSMLPVNFQSFFNVPLFSSPETDKTVGKIANYLEATNSYRQNSIETNRPHESTGIKEDKQDASVSSATKIENKAEQVKFTANAVNKIYAGEIELSSDLYNAVINAKNRIASLRSLDVDDLVSQIKNKMKLLIENGGSKLSVELKPENLGTVLMSISSNKGVLSINIYADQAAKQALEENLSDLKRSLELSDLNIDNLTILSDDRREHNKGEKG
jgi:flagellar hook-length control protein FliK